MAVKMTITRIHAREILDSRGNPTIEVEVLAGGEIIGKASMAGKNYSKKEQTEKQQVHIEEKIELLNSQIVMVEMVCSRRWKM